MDKVTDPSIQTATFPVDWCCQCFTPMRSFLVYSLVARKRKLGIKLQLNPQAKGQLSAGMFVASNSQMESLRSTCVLVPQKCCFKKQFGCTPPLPTNFIITYMSRLGLSTRTLKMDK